MPEHLSFLIAAFITASLVFITVLIHYEVLRLISEIIPKLTFMQPRLRILVVIYGAFFAHTLEVWLFAAAYYLLNIHLSLGSFHGLATAAHFYDFLYLIYKFCFISSSQSYLPFSRLHTLFLMLIFYQYYLGKLQLLF